MKKLIVFRIGNGDFEQGFPINMQISEEGKLIHESDVQLPAAPEIPVLYQKWQTEYSSKVLVQRIIESPQNQVTNVSSRQDCKEAANKLKAGMKKWFETSSFTDLRRHVLDLVKNEESASLIFKTNNELLQKLPWQEWDIFELREKLCFSLSAQFAPHSQPLKKPVKVLAISGNDEGVNVQKDIDLLQNIPGARVEILKKPTRKKLQDKLWEESWDILFFAGHSSSLNKNNSGEIQLNSIDTLNIDDFKITLKKAIKKGLKIAIFNSCDGLGLANKLAELKIPRVIVMREPVPDEVAQEFLREFLRLFSGGELFSLAVRQALERLEGIEDQYPGASWLPVICQNPAEKPLAWPKQNWIQRFWYLLPKKKSLIGIVIGIVLIALLIKLLPFIIKNIPTQRGKNIPIQRVIDEHLFSWGDKLLIETNKNQDKERGIENLKHKNYDEAIRNFRKALQQKKNDPETLIYLNNAIAEKNKKTLDIAVAVPSSVDSNASEEILRGVAHAQSELNCGIDAIVDTQSQLNCTGGINGKLLRVQIANDEDNYGISRWQVAQKFVQEQNILGVIGHYSSTSTLNAARKYKEAGLAVISPTSTSVELNNYSNYVFRTSPGDDTQAQKLFDYMRSELKMPPKVAINYVKGDSYSDKSLAVEFEKRLNPEKFVYKCELAQTSLSAKECVDQAKQKQANVLLLVPPHNTTEKALEVVQEILNSKNENLKLLGGDTMYNPKTLEKACTSYAGTQNNLVIFVPWHRSGVITHFEQDAQKLWGTPEVNWRTLVSYDATKAIIEGLKDIKDNPTRQRLREDLSNPNFSADGAVGKVQFTKEGDRKSTASIGVLVQVKHRPDNSSKCYFERLDH